MYDQRPHITVKILKVVCFTCMFSVSFGDLSEIVSYTVLFEIQLNRKLRFPELIFKIKLLEFSPKLFIVISCLIFKISI